MFFGKNIRNKVFFVLISASLAGGLLSACDGTRLDNSVILDVAELDTVDPDKEYEDEITIYAIRTVEPPYDLFIDDLYAPFLKEKFNIELNMTFVSKDDFNTKLSAMFASGQELDLIFDLRPERMLNEWITLGKILGFTKEDIDRRMPNYFNIWEDKQHWDNVYANISHSDGKVYYFPGKRPTDVNMAWIFRKDLFNELNVNEYPKNLDELHALLLSLKNHTGKVPYVETAGIGRSPLWAFTGFLQAFDMPELVVRTMSYVDPRTDTFYPYAFEHDNYREFLIYMNKLYKDGLIWGDFMTASKEMTDAFYKEGNGHVRFGYPERIETSYNMLSKIYKDDAIWEWSRDMIGHDPENGVFFKREPYFNANGLGFANFSKPERLNRTIDFADWLFSEEGSILHTFGFEGINYEMVNGHYLFTDVMQSPSESEGDTIWQYGVILETQVQHKALNEEYRPYLLDVRNAFFDRDKYFFHREPVLNFTEDQTRTLADLEAGINDVRDEYAFRFIMGQLDPADDSSWDWYIDALERVGLETLREVRREAYERKQ